MVIKEITKKQYDAGMEKLIDNTVTHLGIKRQKVVDFVNEKREYFDKNCPEMPYLERVSSLKKSILLKLSKPSNEKDFEVIIFAKTNVTDYGQSKKYDRAIQEYKLNPQKAIKEGFTNEYGEPILGGRFNINKWVIKDFDKLFSKRLFGFIEVDNELKKIEIVLKGKKTKLNVSLLQKLKINGVRGKDKDGWIRVYSNKNTEIELLSNEVKDVTNYLDYLKEELSLSRTQIENPSEIEDTKLKFFIKESLISIDCVNDEYMLSFFPIFDDEREDIKKGLINLKPYTSELKYKSNFTGDAIAYVIGKSYENKIKSKNDFEIYGLHIVKKIKENGKGKNN